MRGLGLTTPFNLFMYNVKGKTGGFLKKMLRNKNRVCSRWQTTYDPILKHKLNALLHQFSKEIGEFENSRFSNSITNVEKRMKGRQIAMRKEKVSIPSQSRFNFFAGIILSHQ